MVRRKAERRREEEREDEKRRKKIHKPLFPSSQNGGM
jgi:hypothetical protein